MRWDSPVHCQQAQAFALMLRIFGNSRRNVSRNYCYSRVPGDRNWHIETADWNLAGFFTIFRNLLTGIWGSFLRFIETGFRNWLAAFL